MFNSGFPTTTLSLNDASGASTDVLFTPATEGLNVPFFFLMAERGIPGNIYFGGSAQLTQAFGSTTFDPTGKYFNVSSLFAGTAMAAQGVCAMRLVDPAATTATIALFVSVTAEDVTQYQKDVSGARLTDDDGDFVPRLAVDGVTALVEPGVKIKWFVRELADDESFDTLVKKVTTAGAVTTTTYPIVAAEILSAGEYGNRQGFKLFSTRARNATVATSIESVLYRFVPMALPRKVSATASAVPDTYGAVMNDVSFKDSAVYSGTNANYAFNHLINNNYVDGETGDTTLPYNLHTYGANIGLIGQAVLAVSPELGDIDPYLVDLISVADLSGNLYDHVHLDPASNDVVNESVINYATGGSDGDTSWAKFESLVADWLSGTDHGEFGNTQQHPITHYSDPGFSQAVKPLLFNMLDLRDNIKIDVSTQDSALRANTMAEDIAAGQALLFRAQMHPESVINGVGCTRVGIYAHCGYLANSSLYSGLVPFTLNRLIQRRDLDGGSYIKGASGGMPNSQVVIFRKPNWIADASSVQEKSWASCINTVRHANRTQIYYPAIRTVYPNDTSLLSDDEVSDRVIYMIKLARGIYARYAGVRRDPKELYPLIERDIDNDCSSAFSKDNVKVVSSLSQTAQEANLGYSVTANLAISGNSPFRTMNLNVVVQRATAQN
jgi:hypothetical protein